MTETIALPDFLTRQGHTHVNAVLDEILGETGWLTTEQLADLIATDGITGRANTRTSGPVGLWIINDLQAHGIEAVAYSWVAREVHVYDASIRLIGEVTIPEGHTLHALECEVNDGDRGELVWQGEGDQR